MPLEDYQPLVEEAIESLGAKPEQPHADDPLLYVMEKGSTVAALRIAEFGAIVGNLDVLIISSYLIEVPENDDRDFYKQLMDWNHTQFAAEKLTIFEDKLYLTTVLDLYNKDSQELSRAINSNISIADIIDDKLAERFGTE